MHELTFFTTNQTKLAHARYIAEGHGIRIKGFRERTYHAGYYEPRLLSRDEILLASYRSAKAQMAKAGLSEASHPFILEDTSVRISGLSGGEREIPGVDVKYWMKDQKFESLDSTLRALGNDREVTVRSDILLHVPSNLRCAWGVEEEFILFTGEQNGAIIEKEYPFDSNLVYPWLDNRSFNKWFVPDGSNIPLGALPIDVADRVDFRRKSFEPLFLFLKERRYFSTVPVQLKIEFGNKPNVILCGYTCSGKTTASQYLARRFGYLHVEASDFMYLSYFYRHGHSPPASIGDFAESALAQMPTIAAEKVAEYLLDHLNEPVVISGFRSPKEVEFIENRMKEHGKIFIRRFVLAEQDIRFARFQARARPDDTLKRVDFDIRDRQQERMGLREVGEMPQMLLLKNEGTLDSYLDSVCALVGVCGGEEIDIDSIIRKLASISEIGLQEAVVIALLSVWKNDEARKFYTTTEISRLIASTFPSVKPKHKDNVSRYFNQDFYVYFETFFSANGRKRKYRLSNTGYGMAIGALRSALKLV